MPTTAKISDAGQAVDQFRMKTRAPQGAVLVSRHRLAVLFMPVVQVAFPRLQIFRIARHARARFGQYLVTVVVGLVGAIRDASTFQV